MIVGGAVLAGAFLIAISVLLTHRWSIVSTGERIGAFRLDGWTGRVDWCTLPVDNRANVLECGN